MGFRGPHGVSGSLCESGVPMGSQGPHWGLGVPMGVSGSPCESGVPVGSHGPQVGLGFPLGFWVPHGGLRISM